MTLEFSVCSRFLIGQDKWNSIIFRNFSLDLSGNNTRSVPIVSTVVVELYIIRFGSNQIEVFDVFERTCRNCLQAI